MSVLSHDFSVLNKLGLALPPVGVKFDLFRPLDIPQLELDSAMSLCEMLRECQRRSSPFYFSNENTETCVGKCLLGMEEFPPSSESGQIGKRLGIWQDPRGNRNVYRHITKLAPGSVNYVSFAPFNQITFNPDVLVIAANPDQAEAVMRATTYATGMLYKSTATAVMGCSWFLLYPYITGEVNFVLPGIIHGPHGRHLYDSGTVLITIPYHWLPVFLASLEEMPLKLTGHESKEHYYSEFEGILADLEGEMRNP